MIDILVSKVYVREAGLWISSEFGEDTSKGGTWICWEGAEMSDKQLSAGWHKMTAIATLALAILAFGSLLVSRCYMESQVDEMRRATDLTWRPYANIVRDMDQTPMIGYLIGNASDRATRPVDSVIIGSDAYKARSKVVMNCLRDVIIWNSGKTPLWLRSRVSAILREEEWLKKYDKSPEKMIADIASWPVARPFETDFVIRPSDTSVITPDMGGLIPRSMEVAEFETARDSTHRLVLYPYTYIQYEDYRGNRYNLLQVSFFTLNVDTANSRCRVVKDRLGDEVYRWDVETVHTLVAGSQSSADPQETKPERSISMPQFIAYVVGYFYVVVIAGLMTWLAVTWMWEGAGWSKDKDPRTRPTEWQPVVTGIIERILFVTAFLNNFVELVGFWLVIKVASEWSLWKEGMKPRRSATAEISGRTIYMNLVNGTGLSLLYAFVGYKLITWLTLPEPPTLECWILGLGLPGLTLLLWLVKPHDAGSDGTASPFFKKVEVLE